MVSLSFTGSAIAVYGSAQQNHGAYNSSLDGKAGSYNASSPFSVSPALLFFQAGLDPNITHRLNLTHSDPSQAYFDVDSFVIYKLSTVLFVSHEYL
jgi:hypothetical protein